MQEVSGSIPLSSTKFGFGERRATATEDIAKGFIQAELLVLTSGQTFFNK